MDKVFITKSELTKMMYKQKSKAGPFLMALTLFWLLTSLLLELVINQSYLIL